MNDTKCVEGLTYTFTRFFGVQRVDCAKLTERDVDAVVFHTRKDWSTSSVCATPDLSSDKGRGGWVRFPLIVQCASR